MKKNILILVLMLSVTQLFSQNEFNILLQEAKNQIVKQDFYQAIVHNVYQTWCRVWRESFVLSGGAYAHCGWYEEHVFK